MAQTYSKKKDGAKQLSANFKVSEFACKDGSDTILIDERLVLILQSIRSHFGKSVVINSGYRTPAYNTKIGGAKDSQHICGTAADITVDGVKPADIAAYAEKLLYQGGIGRYPSFTHVDVRAVRARWSE